MNNFIFIFTNNVLPIFIQIGFGFMLKKALDFNISPLAKIQLYILIPALIFVKMYSSQVGISTIILITAYSLLLFTMLYIISMITAKILKLNRSQKTAFINSVCFYNSGNFSIPLIQLLYADDFALSVQFINMTVQNFLTSTVGIFNSNFGKMNFKKAIIEVLKVPMIYGVLAAFILKGLKVPIWNPIWTSLDSLGSGLVPVALITLGAQLAQTKLSFKVAKVYVATFYRLLLSPVIAFLVVLLLGMKGIPAQVLIISSAAPTAVNAVLLAIEYKNDPEFVSQTIFLSTLLSTVTVSTVIYFVGMLG